MHPAPLSQEHRAAAPMVGEGLRLILTGLAALVARALLRQPRYAALILPLWTRLTRTARRFDRLMARVAAGTDQPRGGGARSGGAPRSPLPRRNAWLLAALRHEGGHYHQRLATLLDDPRAAAILAASPQAARLLRPLCRMLGLRHPALPALARRRPRPAASPSPASAPAFHAPAEPALPFRPSWHPLTRLAAGRAVRPPPPAPHPDDPPCHHRQRWPWAACPA